VVAERVSAVGVGGKSQAVRQGEVADDTLWETHLKLDATPSREDTLTPQKAMAAVCVDQSGSRQRQG
jgi:hypothetical protein